MRKAKLPGMIALLLWLLLIRPSQLLIAPFTPASALGVLWFFLPFVISAVVSVALVRLVIALIEYVREQWF